MKLYQAFLIGLLLGLLILILRSYDPSQAVAVLDFWT